MFFIVEVDNDGFQILDSSGNDIGSMLDGASYRLLVEALIKRSSTTAVTNVAGSTSNVTLLASNANRLGASIYNDTNKDLYLKLGATASTSSFTVVVPRRGLYEVPFGYPGIIDGLWASGVSGAALVTENT